MSEKDFMVGAVGMPVMGQVSKKPCYLIALEDTNGKTKSTKYFIALDKPDLLNGFVQAKGVYTDASEDLINKNFSDIVNNTSKESIFDIMFPWHRVSSIRNLIFKAK